MKKECIFEACYLMYLHCIYYIPTDFLDFLKEGLKHQVIL